MHHRTHTQEDQVICLEIFHGVPWWEKRRAIILERLKRIHGSDKLILHLMIGNRM